MFTFFGLVDDLVEVVDSFLLLEMVVRVDACASEEVGSSVGRVYHVGCSEELYFW